MSALSVTAAAVIEVAADGGEGGACIVASIPVTMPFAADDRIRVAEYSQPGQTVIPGFKVTDNGFEVIMREPAAARLIGLHLGMFQGESSGSPPAGRNITNNAVFIRSRPVG
jgi:hypothetical protein